MTFYERLDAVVVLLRRRGRVSYRALAREFDLDDAYLADLKLELIEVQRVAADEDGKILVWTGATVDAERRQVTVMFCDLVSSTGLAERFDPEELRDVLRAYQAVADEVVRRFGGVIARYVGDGLLIYFGYPQAHGDDGQCAARAALELVAAVRRLQARLEPTLPPLRAIPLRVRIGLHTGLAVMGALGDSAQHHVTAVGSTTNIAARLQGLADPDTVLVTEATHQLLHGAFVCEPLGPQSLKGIADPVSVYRVVAEEDTVEGVAPTYLGPLLGREQEVGLLLDRWAQVKEGRGQIVVLSGEAGIGKSRLVQALEAHAAAGPHLRLQGRCSPYHQHTALYAVTEVLQRALDIGRHDADDARLARLEQRLRESGVSAEETVPFLAPVLGIGIPQGRYPSLALSPDRQRRRTLETVIALLLELAARQPVLLVVEDLHWVDPSTLEWLGLLIEQAATAPLFAVLTARPDFISPWAGHAHLTALTLTRLRRSQIEALVTDVAGGKALPDAVVEQIVLKTDGVPLFIEELTKMVVESGLLQAHADRYELAGPLPPLAIPATLQDSLMARLDRLTTAKGVAQVAATIGRSFPYALLQAVSMLDASTLRRELGKLLDAELLYQRGVPPQATYTFRHTLIQETAYQTLLKSTRQHHHWRIAQALETKFPTLAEAQPEVVAHHYTEAGLVAQAIPYWQRAGEQAVQRSAYVEAVGHLGKALTLLETLPDTSERAQQELALRLALGRPLVATKGQAARAVEQTYSRARELSQRVGDGAQMGAALFGLSTVHLSRGELPVARKLGEELLTLLQRAGDPFALVGARQVLGATLFLLGEPALAYEHADAGVTVYRRHHARTHLYGREVGVLCQVYGAMALQLLGYPARAGQAIAEARRLAEELSDPFSQVIALAHSAWVHQHRREPVATLEWAEATLTLSREQGFPHYETMATALRGWALAKLAKREEGMAEMSRAATAPHYLAMLAESHADAGEIQQGLAVLAQAQALTETATDRWWLAEQHRLTGELLLLQSVPDEGEAERCFLRALDVAGEQGAKAFELRAATSIGRLRRRQGRTEEGRRPLAEIYGWFTEGHDTADLQDAKAALEALS